MEEKPPCWYYAMFGFYKNGKNPGCTPESFRNL